MFEEGKEKKQKRSFEIHLKNKKISRFIPKSRFYDFYVLAAGTTFCELANRPRNSITYPGILVYANI